MEKFDGIVESLQTILLATGGDTIGEDPPIHVRYNPGGGGFTPSLVFELNSGVHITIYQDSWDGQISITDLGRGSVSIGPHCLHLTAKQKSKEERWFLQYAEGGWHYVTDFGTPTTRVVKTFNTMLNTIRPYLG